MKKLTHKLGFVLTLFTMLLSFSAKAKKSSEEKTREIHETYFVTPQHKILLNNKFGEVKINSWEQNEVAIDIVIVVKDGNDKRAQDLMDRIKIDIVKTDGKFSVKTMIDGDEKDLEVKVKNNGYLKIDYTIKVPVNNILEVKNAFGPIVLDKMNANVKIDLSFGAANIGELNGDANDLDFDFCDPAVVNRMYGGKINLKFSTLELIESKNLVLTSQMSSSKIDKVEKAQCSVKLGSLDISLIGQLILESQMSVVKIEEIHDNAKIENKYGTLKIAKLLPSVTKLQVNGEFSPIKIGLDSRASYQIDAEAKMSKLKLPESSVMEEQKFEPNQPAIKTTSSFKGRVGKKINTPTVLELTSSFGEIKVILED